MNEKNKNLVLRIVTAVLLLPVVLWLVGQGGFWSAGLMAFAAAVCAYEYQLITSKTLAPVGWAILPLTALLPLLPALDLERMWMWACLAGGVAFFLGWIWHLLFGPLPEAPTRAAHLLTAFVYGGMGLSALSALRLRPHDGVGWVIAALTITWANDTSAYFAGRFLGRHKLYPAVSPNKTWEGFFGGMVGSLLGMAALKLWPFPYFTWLDCAALGVAGGILGPLGDLCESMLKRAYQVKDSSRLVPGHGGLLDRIDALVFNAPMVFAWVVWVRH